eukprot:m.23981 g.23981  ORF g.23981 m.23981 type:complete len:209 (+) comp11457_c0_seq2:95-721(+)
MAVRILTLESEAQAIAAAELLQCFFLSLAGPAVLFWLERYGVYVAGLLAVVYNLVSWYFFVLFLAAVIASLKFLGQWEMRRYVANAKDLAELQTAFKGPKSAFWVALDSHDQVIGCVGLLPTAEDDTAELVRFVVSEQCRGQGVGQALVETLQAHAIDLGYSTLTLRTNNILKSALSFYTKAGFELERVQRRRLLRGDLLFYRKALGK